MYVVNLNLVSDWTDISIENTCGGVHIDLSTYTLQKVFENFHNIINTDLTKSQTTKKSVKPNLNSII